MSGGEVAVDMAIERQVYIENEVVHFGARQHDAAFVVGQTAGVFHGLRETHQKASATRACNSVASTTPEGDI